MIIDIIGYIGMAFLLIGIALVRKKNYALYSDLCILVGDIGLAINCFYYSAIPACIVNAIIAAMTVFNIRKDLREKKRKKIERLGDG